MLSAIAAKLIENIPSTDAFSREADFTSVCARALAQHFSPAQLAFSRDYHGAISGTDVTQQHRGRFNTYDMTVLTTTGAPEHVFGVKFAREEKTGFLWQFDLLIFDLLVVGLEAMHLATKSLPATSAGALVYITADIYDRSGPAGAMSPFREFFPLASTPRTDELRLKPSVAAANPGQGRTKTWPSYRSAETVTRSHLSTAVTGGLNPKLMGYFERDPFELVITYESLTSPYRDGPDVAGYVACILVKSVFVVDGGLKKETLADVLTFIP